eukprot:scaffold1928_cov103-Isochrysis_galbana.AAC.5
MPSGHPPSPFPFFPIPSPSSGRLLRRDAIIGWVDQQSAGAEGAPEIIGRAPGEMVKGGGGKGGDASPPEDSRVSCRIRPLAHLILKKKLPVPGAGALASGQAVPAVRMCACMGMAWPGARR